MRMDQNSRVPNETSHGYGYTWGRVTDNPRCGGPEKCEQCASEAANRSTGIDARADIRLLAALAAGIGYEISDDNPNLADHAEVNGALAQMHEIFKRHGAV
jgi:hypothetical protein